MTKEKKAILLLWTYLIILLTPKNNNKENKIIYNPNYTYGESLPFAKYQNKNIYIIKMADLKSNDIYILDDRENTDPNMQIYNSYKIKNIKDIDNILKILEEYEQLYPSKWKRSHKSMRNEWIIHNICYLINHKTNSTKHVDLNNKDEETYSKISDFLNEIMYTLSENKSYQKKLLK